MRVSSFFSGLCTATVVILATWGSFFLPFRYAELRRHYGDVGSWVEAPAEVRVREGFLPVAYNDGRGRVISPSRSMILEADYTYRVASHSYEGHTVSAHGQVERDKLPLPIQSVFYNPDCPEEAVLIRDPVQRWPLALMGFIDAILIAAGLSYLRIRTGWRRLGARIAQRRAGDPGGVP